MTRRSAVIAVIASVCGSLQEQQRERDRTTSSGESAIAKIEPVGRILLVLGEGGFREIEVHHNGERVVLSAAEVFAALKEGR